MIWIWYSIKWNELTFSSFIEVSSSSSGSVESSMGIFISVLCCCGLPWFRTGKHRNWIRMWNRNRNRNRGSSPARLRMLPSYASCNITGDWSASGCFVDWNMLWLSRAQAMCSLWQSGWYWGVVRRHLLIFLFAYFCEIGLECDWTWYLT